MVSIYFLACSQNLHQLYLSPPHALCTRNFSMFLRKTEKWLRIRRMKKIKKCCTFDSRLVFAKLANWKSVVS